MKSSFNYLVIILLFLIHISCSENGSGPENETIDHKLQQALNDIIIHAPQSKGIAAAVIFPEGHVWTGAAGISHGTTPVSNATLFSAGSITKSFTAVTIIKMVRDGLLALDDPLHKWFPQYPNVDTLVTIRQLLNHTSGIFNVTENQLLWNNIFNDRQHIWNAADVLDNYILEPYFDRGTGWHYCNTGYIMLRKLICDLHGSSIAPVYRNRIFDPLGLDNTFLYAEEELPADVAHGWLDINNNEIYDDITSDPLLSFYSAAGGGIFATPLDLARWAHELFIEGSVVTPEQLDQMMEFYTPVPDQPLVEGYGLGIVHFNPDLFNGLMIYGHSGDAPGYAAGSFYIADFDICLGIADNTDEGEAMWVINDLLTIIADEYSH